MAGSHRELPQCADLPIRWSRKIGIRLCKEDVTGACESTDSMRVLLFGDGWRVVVLAPPPLPDAA
ncbi:hypothetical protein GCM10023193_45390 [Planotetraspora kaengkrachanensis]|uniref:Uncharacterized protein n=1 Tax=Planotetraspora kaengkrachanensis TaxID=575193 RepID=A0A8J3Q009_9ACTN|nr:hypothetical protein Pka01_73690 [Planotetraspora kaengkrachanensis]